jgi:hypothetical protein
MKVLTVVTAVTNMKFLVVWVLPLCVAFAYLHQKKDEIIVQDTRGPLSI